MDLVKRVHVAALGYEFDRILEPIRDQRADLVYLLADADGDVEADYHAPLQDELEDIVPEIRTRECDLTDVYAVLGDVTTIASRHADDVVAVNVSSAGRVAAIGMTMACMDVSTNAHPYYVEPESYAHDPRETPTTEGVADVEQLPIYPIDSPTPDQVAIMGFLAAPGAWDGYHDERTSPPMKKDLIEYARDVDLSFMADRQAPGDRPGEDKGAFRILDTHVLDPLADDGYVTVESVGRRRVVELTDRGANAFRAFRHKLSALDGVDDLEDEFECGQWKDGE